MFLNLVIGCLLICFIDLLMDSLMDDILIIVFFFHTSYHCISYMDDTSSGMIFNPFSDNGLLSWMIYG